MQFTPTFLDELRARLSPSEVIGQNIKLRHVGRGEHKGICPFHPDKDPSLTVSDPKGFYHCFACSAHGDIIKFTMEYKGLSFVDAVKELATLASLPLPVTTPAQQRYAEKSKSLHELMETACKWFEAQLHTAQGQNAMAYIRQRGLSDETQKIFRLGYAPDNRTALKQALEAKGFSTAMLLEGGLLTKPDTGEPYDRFRGRLIFPICDTRGKVIAFGGRILGDGQPKYLNSPETPLFHKGRVLYAFHLARETAYKRKNIAIAEGYMDVIALHQAGISNAVAPLGTAITEEQLQQLWKCAPEPVLCLDGDAAGQRAMYRAAELALPLLTPGHSLQVAVLPEGQDPDDVIKARGASAIRNLLKSATPLADILWKMAIPPSVNATPDSKAAFADRIMQFVSHISHKTVQDYYRSHFSGLLWEFRRQQNPKGKSHHDATASPQVRLVADQTPQNNLTNLETRLLVLAAFHPHLLHDASVEDHLMELHFSTPELDQLRNRLLNCVSSCSTDDIEAWRAALEEYGAKPYLDHVATNRFYTSYTRPMSQKEAQMGWEYTLADYQLAHTEMELMQEISRPNVSPERLDAMKTQRDTLKTLAESKKMAYEAAFNDDFPQDKSMDSVNNHGQH